MKNKIIKKLAILALFSLFLLTNIVNTYAFSNNENILKIDYSNEKFKYDINNIEVKFWKLGEITLNKDKKELLSDLHNLEEKDLDLRYHKVIRKSNIENNLLTIDKIEDGFYYTRFNFNYEDSNITTEFIFSLPYQGQNEVKVIAKNIIKKQSVFDVRLLKVDDEANKLSNVGFELHRILGDNDYLVETYGNYIYKDINKNKASILYTGDDGLIIVKDLPYGTYYFKEVSTPKGYINNGDKHYFTSYEKKDINLKIINEKRKVGSLKFLKQSDDKYKKPLEGAIFRIVQIKDNKEESLLKDNKPVELRSDENGIFTISDLAYGTYKIYETKAPEGYVKLEDSLDFVINGESNKKVLIIKNKKKPPFTIPQTGDAVAMVLLIVALIFIVIGYRFVNNKKVEK